MNFQDAKSFQGYDIICNPYEKLKILGTRHDPDLIRDPVGSPFPRAWFRHPRLAPLYPLLFLGCLGHSWSTPIFRTSQFIYAVSV